MHIINFSVSIPSRGFWFFEEAGVRSAQHVQHRVRFQSPRGDFGFLKVHVITEHPDTDVTTRVSIPSRGFWFFEDVMHPLLPPAHVAYLFQSPRGDFGFLKRKSPKSARNYLDNTFQSPRGDFGFLKLDTVYCTTGEGIGFNPLAGILVF